MKIAARDGYCAWQEPAEGRRLIVGVGEFAVSGSAGEVIVTHALASCIAVCICDPVARVSGMLHFLLPDSRINAERARERPAVFADTGIPLLFRTAYQFGLQKKRTIVKLVGGAATTEANQATFMTGHRNVLAARQILWRNGVLVNAEETGGNLARTVQVFVDDGRVRVLTGRNDSREI